ncbi:MAG: NADP-dependent phosphogluconate dehydrogenase [Dictyoglomus sp.]|nr:NADP-dependent phosphogluconate dehydrogenase [Dictyoglomus sp.]MCX7942442.1 NADP-dependent phosphogluconate dehydrogenase [Dictyoglomaceae bacterium]MDW8189293.1 NADP-dependent phosphogluconate dehydrogenase [Dictyoglomus sp.]
MKGDIGLVGLAVMGQNLALNIARKGYSVSVYNRTPKKTEEFLKEKVKEEKIIPCYDLKNFVDSLEKPRKIILMVKAGNPVDEMINDLLPYLDPGDLIIDGGNSHYLDTSRRIKELKEKGILYLGMGVSGGEYGALYGPSLMPGGSETAYKMVEDLLLKISAKTDDGPCCTFVGRDSAGHFVKMVHNGIEYAYMQAIAETYDIMRKALKMNSYEIGDVFENWNKGELNSFLMEISYKIMRYIDREKGIPLVELILDKAEQKGTGKWTAQSALDLGVPTPSLNLAVEARTLSYFKDLRKDLSKKYSILNSNILLEKEKILKDLEKSLLFALFMAFSQGLWLISSASKAFDYGINLSEVLRIWKGGCIIRAKILNFLREIINENPENVNLLNSEKSISFVKDKLDSIKNITKLAKDFNIATLVLNSSLDYFLSLIEEDLPANLIQAQRDFFGAHTFERKDKEGIFHIQWEEF